MKNKNKKYTPSLHWAIPEIKPNRGGRVGGGVEDMKFPGVSKKEIACGISRIDQEKIMWKPGVFGHGISIGCNAILHNFQGWSFDLSRISRGKVNKQKKIPWVFSKKYVLNPFLE